MRHHKICLAFSTPATSLLRCWKLSSSTCMLPLHAKAFQFQQQQHRRNQVRHLSIMNAGTSEEDNMSSELEIEKKFSIPDTETAEKMEQTLASLGFKISRREEFVDWYFDLPAPQWHFSLNDCWFRYREKKIKVANNNWGWRGAWQVKRGNKKEEHGGDGMTVYEELQGKAAKELILDMLAEKLSDGEVSGTTTSESSSSSALFDQYNGCDIPHLAGAESLAPFARLETFRTSYQNDATNTSSNDGEFSTLKVDIDKTDFGHMVGEVEAVIDPVSNNNEVQVEAAKDNIRKLVDLISIGNESDASMAAVGKLEYYLINNHRDHYDACVKSGVIKKI